jgi:hypothetical protein
MGIRRGISDLVYFEMNITYYLTPDIALHLNAISKPLGADGHGRIYRQIAAESYLNKQTARHTRAALNIDIFMCLCPQRLSHTLRFRSAVTAVSIKYSTKFSWV